MYEFERQFNAKAGREYTEKTVSVRPVNTKKQNHNVDDDEEVNTITETDFIGYMAHVL